MDMKVYEVVFDEKESSGVYALSCVDSPAMEDKWLTLADHPKEIQFSVVEEEKRLLLGAALIPNKKIYRKDDNDEYYITFSEKTIEDCAHAFVKNGFVNNSSENHAVKLEGVSVVQSWIVDDPQVDKSAKYGKTYEKGTWVTMMKVENDETWKKAKNGELNGFSIDGLFTLKEQKLSTNKNDFIMDKKSLVDTIREALNLSKKDAVKLGEVTLKDGKTKLSFEGEEMEEGKPIFLVVETEDGEPKKEPAPEGKHELENGESIYVDKNGILGKEPEKVEEEEKKETVEMMTAVAEVLKEFSASLKKEIQDTKVELTKDFDTKLGAEKEKSKELETKLSAAEKTNKELEAKLEKEPAAEKIVKTELQIEEPKSPKQRLYNVAMEAFNKN